jgi:hypothetical protein
MVNDQTFRSLELGILILFVICYLELEIYLYDEK